MLPESTDPGIDCVVVGDADDKVVGIGTAGLGEQTNIFGMATGAEDSRRLAAIAPIGSSSYRVLLVLDDGTLVQVGDVIPESQIKGQ